MLESLYLSKTNSDANQIIMSNNPMAIRIVIASRLVSRDRFIEALEEEFKNTTVGKYTQLEIESFKEYLSDPFKLGDEIILVYSSEEESTFLYKNTKFEGSFQVYLLNKLYLVFGWVINQLRKV